MNLEAFGRTNVGNKRQRNEDDFLIDADLGLYLVADSCGSTTIARELLDIIATHLNETKLSVGAWPMNVPSATLTTQRITSAVKLANTQAHQRRAMGTALAGALFVEDSAFLMHVGDCRVYQLRNKTLEPLTEDHTLVNEYLKMGKLRPEDVENFPHRNVITRVLGGKPDIQVDMTPISYNAGDLFLLCTDGLYNDVKEEQMKEIVLAASSLEEACAELLRTADENRGSDNATVILVRC